MLYLSVAEGEFKFSIPFAFFQLYSNSMGIILLFVVTKPPTGRSDILFTSPFCTISTDNDDFFGIYLPNIYNLMAMLSDIKGKYKINNIILKLFFITV